MVKDRAIAVIGELGVLKTLVLVAHALSVSLLLIHLAVTFMMMGVGGETIPPAPSAGCSQATTFLARTSLTGSDVTNYTTLICGLVTDNIITGTLAGTAGCGSKLDVLYVFATADSTNALLNICGTNFSAVLNGAPAFSAYNGFTGVDASSTVFIDSQFNASTAGGNYTQNSAHVSTWNNTNVISSSGGGFVAGMTNSSFNNNNTQLVPRHSEGNAFFRINDDGSSAGVANADSRGHFLDNRTDSTHNQGYIDASNVLSPNTTSVALPNTTMYFLGIHQATVGSTNGSGLQVSAATIGAGLSSTDVTNLCHRINVYMTTVNGTGSVC